MYEAEVNGAIEQIDSLPSEIRQRFSECRGKIAARTILPWGEHCTECVWPTCYTVCELYSPRQDGACRQFVDGMVRIDQKDGATPYLLKIRFKQWAKLWTVGNLALRSPQEAVKKESFNIAVGALVRGTPLPTTLRVKAMQKVNYLRRQAAERAATGKDIPDCFMLECFNPDPEAVSLTLTIRRRSPNGAPPFQKMIRVPSGFMRERVPFSEISRFIDLSVPFEVEIVPSGGGSSTLYFGMMDFVKEIAATVPVRSTSTRPIKCIVWDLDNTLWDGILIEGGPEKIRVRQDVVAVIREMDQRGILHSIASKNNREDVVSVLRAHGLEEYFLYPQINWEPKSQSIARIAQLLNIGIDSLAFVDDQAFEREEVRSALAQVRVIDALEYAAIPALPEVQVPVTEESRNRRSMYREQERRNTASEAYKGDYKAFLRDCQMEIEIAPVDEANLQRVYELAQRTNQLNFSGNRYQLDELRGMMNSSFVETYVISAKDRFGNYGIVGFGAVDTREPRLLDLMFSCRVQGKRVEHAVLAFLLKRFAVEQNRSFYANYRRTPKNTPGGKVFEEMGFQQEAEIDGLSSLVFDKNREIADDGIINIQTGAYCE